MRKLVKLGIISFAFGIFFVGADSAQAQNRRATREYREDVRDARRDYRRDIRKGDSRREAQRDYNEELRDARRDYVRNVQRDRNGWFYYQNNRRYYRPFSQWNYRNGYFIRRY
jgi:hypothetical protein